MQNVASWSKKIYLSFWLTLIFITAVGALWLPKILDQGKEGSIKELEAAPQLDFSDEALGQVVTRFPTRPFLDKPDTQPTQPLQPTELSSTPMSTELGPGGLPTRHVPGVSSGEALGERVTTRAYLRGNSSVFTQPQTTAKILGRVGTQTKVRWLANAGEGWEEILLKDGSSAYVQSVDLSFSADSPRDSGTITSTSQSDGPDVNTLPGTVESFLGLLSRQDLLRAETLLSPLAPRLAEEALGPLGPYVGAPPEGRVNRIEQIGGGRGGHRRVRVVYGPDMLHEVNTLWEWDRSQGRWMLVSWD